MTAHHWRTIRLKLIQAGISNPMALTTMHILLDTTEAAILESFSMSGAKDAELKRSLFLDKLYAPSADPGGINEDGYAAQPNGFGSDEVEASFDAFASVAR